MTFDYANRRAGLDEAMAAAGIELIFVPPGSDLEYLVGMDRDLPTYGATGYTHGWVTGGFFRPGEEPIFCLPRLVSMVHLKKELPGQVVVFNETDSEETFAAVAAQLKSVHTAAVASRAWGQSLLRLQRWLPGTRFVEGGPILNRLRQCKTPAELAAMERAGQIVIDALAEATRLIRPGVTLREIATEIEHQMVLRGSRAPSFETHVGTYGLPDRRDNLDPKTADLPLRAGESVKFDYGAVVNGYCSDFGRTIFCGDPSQAFLDTYNDVLLPAQRAAIDAAVPGARAGDVDLACRRVIEDVGLGEYFIHRTGHCIGLDVHELPYISEEDDTVLEAGMTFTIEPSINAPGRFGMRIEDVVVCAPGSGRRLVPAADDLVVV